MLSITYAFFGFFLFCQPFSVFLNEPLVWIALSFEARLVLPADCSVLISFFGTLLNSILRSALHLWFYCYQYCTGNNTIIASVTLLRYIPLSLFCPRDVCDQQLVECVNVDVTAAGCSHPVSSACHYQALQPPPPTPPPKLLWLLLRAVLILILQTHLTVFMDLSY